MIGSASALFLFPHFPINLFQRVASSAQLFLFRQSPIQQPFELHLQVFDGLFGAFPGLPQNLQALVDTLLLQLHPINRLPEAVPLTV